VANTAGGTGALENVVGTNNGGFNNTAFGYNALNEDTLGNDNTAVGLIALERTRRLTPIPP
jgi:hypothetical protein